MEYLKIGTIKIPIVFLILLGVGIFWFMTNGKWGTIEFDKSTFWVIIGLALWGISVQASIMFKHNTSKIVTNAFFSTTDGTHITLGNYAAIQLGVINSKKLGIIFPGNEGTLITPLKSINKIGDNLAVTSFVIKIEKDLLPPDARDQLSAYELKPPYYFGFEPLSELGKVDVMTLRNENTELHGLVNTYKEIFRGKTEAIEDSVSSLNRISGRINSSNSEFNEAMNNNQQNNNR